MIRLLVSPELRNSLARTLKRTRNHVRLGGQLQLPGKLIIEVEIRNALDDWVLIILKINPSQPHA